MEPWRVKAITLVQDKLRLTLLPMTTDILMIETGLPRDEVQAALDYLMYKDRVILDEKDNYVWLK